MKKDQPKILVLYKKSAYEIYFKERKLKVSSKYDSSAIEKFKETHENHYKSLARVEEILRSFEIPFKKASRGRPLDYSPYSLVITVGGDGTFLEAARHLEDQVIIGINSDPKWSVGRFCAADVKTFEVLLQRFLAKKVRPRSLNRFYLKYPAQSAGISLKILNDVLICHSNPAAMSRYAIEASGVKEEQHSSGLWVSTASGSTGAIHSAGGTVMALANTQIQFRCREPYRKKGMLYRLLSGLLDRKQSLKITSLMREGMIFADGAHIQIPFPFGTSVVLTNTAPSLKAIL